MENPRPFGYALAIRVLQSDLYAKLDDIEREECDTLIKQIYKPKKECWVLFNSDPKDPSLEARPINSEDLYTNPRYKWVRMVEAPSPGSASMGQHCKSCTCGKRAPVQRDWNQGPDAKPAGHISWEEHLGAYAKYAQKYGTSQSAARMAERGGFGYSEFVMLVGRHPITWVPGPIPKEEADPGQPQARGWPIPGIEKRAEIWDAIRDYIKAKNTGVATDRMFAAMQVNRAIFGDIAALVSKPPIFLPVQGP